LGHSIAECRLRLDLSCTLRILIAGVRGGAGGLLISERGKFAASSAKASDDASELLFIHGFLLGGSLPGHGGLAGEDQLRDVGESDGVAAGDALASELPDEIAKEEIHFVGGGETVDVVKKLGGEDFGIDNWDGSAETVGVVGAERGACGSIRWAMVLVDQHVATLAFRADVLAVGIDGGADGIAGFRGHDLNLSED
jgi:hypothetical protein